MNYPIISPSIPFVGQIPGGVQMGTQVIISGHVPNWFANTFAINLVCGHNATRSHCESADIALHLNPRYTQDEIIMNTRRGGMFGSSWDDELKGGLTIKSGSNFEIMITCESSYFRITINGSHYFNFPHRMPFNEIGVIQVTGKVDIHKIEFRQSGSTPGMIYSSSSAGVPLGATPAPVYPTAPSFPISQGHTVGGFAGNVVRNLGFAISSHAHHFNPNPHHQRNLHHHQHNLHHQSNLHHHHPRPAPVHHLPTPSPAQFGVHTTYSSSQGVPLGAAPVMHSSSQGVPLGAAPVMHTSSQGVPLGSQPAPGYPYR